MELGSGAVQNAEVVELTSALDELRILIGEDYREFEIEVLWDFPEALSLVWADRHGIIQVFLNLAKNSRQAMASSPVKQLRISAREEAGAVTIRFEDTGPGVAAPEYLFRPFQRGAASSGLGLYVSREIMRSFGGELVYEPTPAGGCFAVILPVRAASEEANHA
jgi:signal transduction histidine kinase